MSLDKNQDLPGQSIDNEHSSCYFSGIAIQTYKMTYRLKAHSVGNLQ